MSATTDLPDLGAFAALFDPPSEMPVDPAAMNAMTADEIRTAVEAEISAARQVTEGDLAQNRRDARDYYNRRPVGLLSPEENKSQVVLSDVRDTVNWAMPGLMRVFFGGRDMARYDPTRPDQTAQGKQQTDYINHVFLNQCNGFMVTHTLFKNALTEKNGPGRVYTEVKTEVCYEKYEQVSTIEVTKLTQTPGVELLAANPSGPPTQTLDETGQPVTVLFWDIEVRITTKKARLRVKAIPPENFLSSPRAEAIDDDVRFVGERYEITKSDLIALGYDPDTIMNLPGGALADIQSARWERYQDESQGTEQNRNDEMAPVWVTDCYVRIDEDGDGIAELRHIVCAGDQNITILSDEYAKYPPYFDLCPWPMPHTIHGESVFDIVGDLQLIGSILMRNELDNIYRLNNGRWEVVEGMVEIDDMLENQPGGIVRVQQQGSVTALDTPNLGSAPANMRGYLDGVRANRTGMSPSSQGLDASTMRNTTATGISQIMSAAQQIQELVARVFAEGGLKRMFLLMLREFVNGPYKKDCIQLRGEWVDVDPSTWDAEMNVTIAVGLGVGAATERIQNLTALQADAAQLYALGFGGYMIDQHGVKAILDEKIEAMGFRFNPFFIEPVGDPPPPKPDALLIEANSKMQKVQSDLQVNQARIQNDSRDSETKAQIQLGELALKKQELDIRLATDRERIASQERIAKAQINANAKIAIEQARAQASRAEPAGTT
jgi:hypothetical protein